MTITDRIQYAFPLAVDCSPGTRVDYTDGMTLRDYFAAAALTGLLAAKENELMTQDVALSFDYADAMIAHRSK